MLHRVGLVWALLVALTGTATASTTDLPPVGRSLFDQLTSRRTDGPAVQRVPYPFEALLAELNARAGKDVLGRPGLAAVLIPVGRSLQRNASPGDYFRHPRIVVAMTGESPPGSGTALLRDRLFLGFQDESDIIEVISYNEQAGRFEFQIVTDYRAGATPKVFYARRAVCTTCHQGGAPIFSRPSWDETNANPAIAQALSAHAKRFHGVSVARGVDVPNAIDDSVARANRIAVTQAIWRQGCAALGNPRAAVECRSEALFAALRVRLAASAAPIVRGLESEPQLDQLVRGWKTLWPQGVPEPDPNIPNRDPFFGKAQQLGRTTATLPYAADEVPPALDPMTMRRPLALWRADAAGKEHFVRALGEMLSRADIEPIARALAKSAAPTQPGSTARPPRKDVRATTEETLQRALAAMRDETLGGRSNVLNDGAFDRVRVMKALYGHLGLSSERVCCDSDTPTLPPPRVEAVTSQRPDAVPAALQPFFEHCAVCHGSPADSPPGFLAGSTAEVETSLRRCAPRIRYRLSMWQVEEGARAKTPMPPPVFVPSWRHAPPRDDIARMMRHVDGALDPSSRDRIVTTAYEQLPACREPHRAPGALGR